MFSVRVIMNLVSNAIQCASGYLGTVYAHEIEAARHKILNLLWYCQVNCTHYKAKWFEIDARRLNPFPQTPVCTYHGYVRCSPVEGVIHLLQLLTCCQIGMPDLLSLR